MNKKGFTLVELLAVIVVLGIIAVITISVIVGIIDKTKMKAYEVAAKNVIDAAKEYVTRVEDNNDFPEGGIKVEDIDLKKDKYVSGKVYRDEEGVITLENLSDGEYCASGSKQEITVVKVSNGKCEQLDATSPIIETLKVREVGRENAFIQLTMRDTESGIKEYKYCVGNCEEENDYKTIKNEDEISYEEITKIIEISNLKENQEYKINVKVINNNNKEAEKSIRIKTLEIEAPTYSMSSGTYTSAKILTITYPKDEDNAYIYGYTYKGETKKFSSAKNIVKLEITENSVVEAAIYKEETELIKTTINISGIDKEGPITTVTITPAQTNYNGWATSKIVKAEAKDNGIGLALRPFKYNEDTKWISTSKEYKTNSKLRLLTRDRLSNETNEFIIDNQKYTEYEIKEIDSEGPSCNIKTTGLKVIATNEWFVNTVTVEVELVDKYKDSDEQIVTGGSGVNIDKTEFLVNNVKVVATKKANVANTYILTISNNGIHSIKVNTYDNLNNGNTCQSVVKKDSTVPTIRGNISYTFPTVGETRYHFTLGYNQPVIELFTKSNYGVSSGVTTCYVGSQVVTNVSELTKAKNQFGVNLLTCVMRANNGYAASATFNASHKYNAKVSGCTDGRTLTADGHCTYYYSNDISRCGCAAWKTCENAACGVASYKSCSSAACGTNTCSKAVGYNNDCVEWKTSTVCDPICRKKKVCAKYEMTPITAGCNYVDSGGTCYYDCGYKTCRTAACGVASYNSCSNSACGCSYGNSCNLTEDDKRIYTCDQVGNNNSTGMLIGTTCYF